MNDQQGQGDDRQVALDGVADQCGILNGILKRIADLGDLDSLPPDRRAEVAALLDQVEARTDQLEWVLFPPGAPILMCKRRVAELARTMIEAEIGPAEIRATIRGVLERTLPHCTEAERPLVVTHAEAALDDVLGPEGEV
jgi:hypothetical protein